LQLDVLQYGALGLAALVLGYMSGLIKRFLDGAFKQSEDWFCFVKEEMAKVNAERTEQAKTWHDTVKDSVKANVLVVQSLKEISKSLEDQSKQFSEMLKYIEKLNGGSK
jgi:hypothetical protein